MAHPSMGRTFSLPMHKAAVMVVAVLALGVAAGCGGGSNAGSSSGVVKIGVTAPLTGPDAVSGQSLQAAMQYAVKLKNAQGGVRVNGHKKQVQLLFEDTQANPATGLSGATKLITQQHVSLLVGDAFSSDVTLAEMNLASQYKIPIVSGEPVSQQISDNVAKDPSKYAYFWKADWSSTAYAHAIVDTYKSLISSGKFTPNSKLVAFVTEDTSYGRTIASFASKYFSQMGWKTTSNDVVPLGETDFASEMTKIKGQSPSVLVSVFTSVSSGIAFAKEFNNLGLNASFFAIYYPLRSQFIQALGSKADGIMWAPLMYEPSANPKVAKFGKAFKKATGKTPTLDTVEGFDYMNLILAAFDRANSTDPAALNKALSKTDYNGLTGRYVFDPKNHTTKFGAKYVPAPVAQIQGGASKIIFPQNFAESSYQKPTWLK